MMLHRAILALLVAAAAPAAAQAPSAAAEQSRPAVQQVFREAGMEVTLPPGFDLPVGGRSERDPNYQSFWAQSGTLKIGILILETPEPGSSEWSAERRLRDMEAILQGLVDGFGGRAEGRAATANGLSFRDFRLTRVDGSRVNGRGRIHVVRSGPHRVITILHSAQPGESVDEEAVVAMFDSLRVAEPAPGAATHR